MQKAMQDQSITVNASDHSFVTCLSTDNTVQNIFLECPRKKIQEHLSDCKPTKSHTTTTTMGAHREN